MSRTKGSSLLYTSAYSQEFAPGELCQKSKTKRTDSSRILHQYDATEFEAKQEKETKYTSDEIKESKESRYEDQSNIDFKIKKPGYHVHLKKEKSDTVTIDHESIEIFETQKFPLSMLFSRPKFIKTAIIAEINFFNKSDLFCELLKEILEFGIKRIQIKRCVLPEKMNESNDQILKKAEKSHNLQSFEFVNCNLNGCQQECIDKIVERYVLNH